MKIHINRGSNFLLALLLAVGAGACNQAGEVTERQMQMSEAKAKSGNDGEMGNPAKYNCNAAEGQN